MVTFLQPHFRSFQKILLLLTTFTCNVNAFESVKTITVRLTDTPTAGAPHVKATLWFDTAIYEFTLDNLQPNTQYALSSTEFTTIGQSDCMDASDAKIMIERGGANAVYIDWISFETYSGIWYGIDGYCAFDQEDIDWYLDPKSSYYDWIQEEPDCPLGYSHLHFCIDNEVSSSGCAPAKQIIYFDVSSPNQYITDALWEDGTAVVPQIVSCNPSNQPTPSPTDHPSKRPSASPTNDPSNGPTASPLATHDPSNQPTASPSDDPSTGPTSSPHESTPSPSDYPFAQPTSSPTEKQIHAVRSTTILGITEETIVATKHMDKTTVNGSSNWTSYWIIILIALCFGIVCVIGIICLLLRKTKALSAEKPATADVHVKPTPNITRIQSISEKIAESDACVVGDIRIVNDIGVTAGNDVQLEEANAEQSSDDDILEVVNQTIGTSH